ncbi:MAG: hypothetical protein JSV96_01980 [Candidatus Aminicenantes bacterium]|nr:MAG: hypothetical protein JSV96_01980 [Candidatus Aminicenantes bacterium]
MKDSKMKKGKRIMAGVLSMSILVLFVAPYQLAADLCDDALGDCMVDALLVSAVAFLAGLAGGPGGALMSAGAVAGGYSAFCATGWVFCKAYFL